MKDNFCVLLKAEFVSLLNNLELKGIPQNKFFNSESKIEQTLLTLPQLDFDEDLIIVKCAEPKVDEVLAFNLHVHEVYELIPLTQTSLSAYTRKFSSLMKWTNPSKYGFEEKYNLYLEERMKRDSKKNFTMCANFLLHVDADSTLSLELRDQVIKGKIDKQLRGKKDIDIKSKEYNHVFQSLLVYEQGSYFSRESAFGFFLHAIGVYILHDGHGEALKLKMKFNSLNFIKTLKDINEKNKTNVFSEIFSNELIIKAIESSKNYCHVIKNNELKVMTYFLFFKFLIEEKKFSIVKTIDIIKEINNQSELTHEENTALLLIAINCSTKKISEDIMIKNENVHFVNSQSSKTHLDFELISNYYRSKHTIKTLPNSELQAVLKTKDSFEFYNVNVIDEIRNELPSGLKNKSLRLEYFKNTILVKYENRLKELGLDLSAQKMTEVLYTQIFKKRKN